MCTSMWTLHRKERGVIRGADGPTHGAHGGPRGPVDRGGTSRHEEPLLQLLLALFRDLGTHGLSARLVLELRLALRGTYG